MKSLLTIGTIIIIQGCSAAGWQGYGPKGDKFIGSALGYKDADMGNGKFLVSYTAADTFDARTGLNKRASELCNGQDYQLLNPADSQHSGSTVSSSVVGGAVINRSSGGLVDAVAEVLCE